jgi:precorrin-6A/cobalt-precorrin-6A reductase
MVLLLGGTSDTAQIATRLAEAGQTILVSTATDEPLEIGCHPSIHRRSGRLDEAAMAALIREKAIRAIVDATHPYAAAVRATASRVAQQLGIPYFSFVRPGSLAAEDTKDPGCHAQVPTWACRDTRSSKSLSVAPPQAAVIRLAPDHQGAARIAFSFGRPVLLTTGSNNLAPYAEQARKTGIALVARVLPRPESIQACRRAGIGEDRVIAAKGPFSVEENRAHIRQHRIGVLVTKDSGEAGGVPAKLEAARQEGCQAVIVERPALPAGRVHASVDDLVADVLGTLEHDNAAFLRANANQGSF